MNARPDLSELTAFLAIVHHRSFRKAAESLELSPSTLSHMMRTLEARLGVRLLHRTTRSVSPTEAGDRFRAQLQPVLHSLDLALDDVGTFRDGPSGTLRINAGESAARLLLHEVLPVFLARYPNVDVDLVSEGRLVDIVAEGFDAGVRLGESVPRDMIAVRLGPTVRFVAIASPAYLHRHGAPLTPQDLYSHRCIRMRMSSGKRYAWDFEKDGNAINVDVPGSLSLDHLELMADAAALSLGIAYVPETVAHARIEAGALEIVLGDWSPPLPGLYLYYPGRRQVPSGLRALIDVIRERWPT